MAGWGPSTIGGTMTSLISKTIGKTKLPSTEAERPPLSVRLFPASQTGQAMARWRELYQRIGRQGLMVSPDWVECWLSHYGDLIPHRFLVLESQGQTVGAALITEGRGQKIGPFSVRTRHLGTAGEPPGESVCVEYNRVLAMPGHGAAVFGKVVESVCQTGSWDSFCLDGFRAEDLAVDFSCWPRVEIRRRKSLFYDLKTAREQKVDLLSRLGRSTRQNTRRLLRKYGELQVEWAESLEQGLDILRELVLLHQARWNAIGQPGAFASQRFSSFQEELVTRLLPRREVVLFRLRKEGSTVGCLMLLVDGKRLLDYLSGFADFASHPSPGVVTHVSCMEQALVRGYDAYDFLVGNKRHKENLSTDSEDLLWVRWNRPTPKYHIIRTLRSLKQKLRQFRNCRKTTGS